MTIDEAIKHCLEVAERYETRAKMIDRRKLGSALENPTACHECAADHRQLAEWLTELKELRCRVFADDPLIETTIEMLDTELKEAKRLLKAAVEDLNDTEACDTCEYYPVINSDMCQKNDCYKWRYADEALKLIES